MYNTSGILYRVFSIGIILLICAIIILMLSLFWNYHKKRMTCFILSIITFFFSISCVAFYSYKSLNPDVIYFEGYLSRSSRDFALSYDYVFFDDSDNSITLHLDSLSKKSIYPNEFQNKKKYRLYYDKQTRIIVKVEELNF